MNAESSKEAIAAALRAVSRSRKGVHYRAANAPFYSISGNVVTLPSPEAGSLALVRGEADSAASWLLYHDEEAFSRASPGSGAEREIFASLEKARVEILGSRAYKGVAKNIGAAANARASALNASDIAEIAGLLLREEMLGGHLPEAEPILKLAAWIKKIAEKELENLAASVNSQEEFSKHALALTEKLLPRMEESKTEMREEDGKLQESQGGPKPNENEAQGGGMEKSGEEKTRVASSVPMLEGDSEPAESLENYYEPEDGEGQGYRVFTREFDEVIAAEKLASHEELARLRAQLDHKMAALKTITNRLAGRLQGALLARKAVSWDLDQEEGVLDSSRLARVIASPMGGTYYKTERERDFKDTVVALLIDNSGSMRGRPIVTAIASADILARVLEQCGVKVEILGFTTRDWKGGKSREKWTKNGSPPVPGRLNDLRHIIYKQASAPWRRARRNLGLALKEGILKENIDGEAVLWAASRLAARPEKRKILMVISDGAPVDDSTLSVNPGNFLDAHLREAISRVEREGEVELLAIGIGHDVGRYYRDAVTISDVSDLGGAMIGKMEKLFKENSA